MKLIKYIYNKEICIYKEKFSLYVALIIVDMFIICLLIFLYLIITIMELYKNV